MSRAFITERDGLNFCKEMQRVCPEADLRGDCELRSCRYVVNKVNNKKFDKTVDELNTNGALD